ncbi:MAG: SpoIIE family protein phosphatase [Leptospiraceae bacterium]|nr:SpoIIE family protein phosphatase [Leptospiraceae bacterium]MCP5495620.1 SpoIIE family protein phosphatase [Leptospiraceae bacterium]
MNKKAILYANKDKNEILTFLDDFQNQCELHFLNSKQGVFRIYESLVGKGFTIPLVIAGETLTDCHGDELLIELYKTYPNTLNILISKANIQILANAINKAHLFCSILEPTNKNEFSQIITHALDEFDKNNILQKDEIIKQNELAIANEIQMSLLPPKAPKWKDLEMVCYSKPAKEVGGDFYTYYGVQKNRVLVSKHIIVVGDVSGKGVSAALLMAISLSRVDASLTMNFKITERMEYLDKILLPFTKPKKQNCALCMLEISGVNTKHPIGKIVNAGCIPPYILKSDGSLEWVSARGFALGQGLGSQFGYKEVKINLSKGDTIILVSDGVIEAHNKNGEMIGFEGFQNILKNVTAKNTEMILDQIQNKIENFTLNAIQHDDMTILVVKI